MTNIRSLDDLTVLAESVELECKLATGQDGRGKLPEDFWATYSAFANTHGGVVILGVKETAEGFELKGVPEPDRLITDLFNNLNNPQKVSANLLRDQDVQKLALPGGTVYFLPDTDLPTPEQVFGDTPSSVDMAPSSVDMVPSSVDMTSHDGSVVPVPTGSRQLGPFSWIVPELDRPIVDALDGLDPTFRQSLGSIASTVSKQGRANPIKMKRAVLDLCKASYLTIGVLAQFLNRTEHYLRKDVLNPLVAQQRLRRAFPTKPNDPRQAYTCSENGDLQ